MPFLTAGLVTGAYLFWIDVAGPVTYHIAGHSVAYHNSGSLAGLFAGVYIVATCGAALASGYRLIVLFGVVVGALVSLAMEAVAFASVERSYHCQRRAANPS